MARRGYPAEFRRPVNELSESGRRVAGLSRELGPGRSLPRADI